MTTMYEKTAVRGAILRLAAQRSALFGACLALAALSACSDHGLSVPGEGQGDAATAADAATPPDAASSVLFGTPLVAGHPDQKAIKNGDIEITRDLLLNGTDNTKTIRLIVPFNVVATGTYDFSAAIDPAQDAANPTGSRPSRPPRRRPLPRQRNRALPLSSTRRAWTRRLRPCPSSCNRRTGRPTRPCSSVSASSTRSLRER